MADRAQLIEALRRADAAGNQEDARKIAAMIRAQPSGPDTRPKSFWTGFKDEIANASAQAMRLARYNPLAPDAGGSQRAAMMDRGRSEGYARSPTQGSTAGRIAGGVVASLPTVVAPLGVVGQGALQGAVLSRSRTPLGVARDVAIGGAAGKAGEVVGKYAIAPVAERIGRTAPVRKVAEAAAKLVRRAPLPLPKITPAERAIAPEVASIRHNVTDAQRLGLPYALADSNTKLRALGGSVSRFSPKAREMAEQTFAPRAAGQADRAVNAIDTLLAPVTNIEQRAGQIHQQAWNASDPLYKEAFEQAAPVDEALAAMMQRPAGKSAMQKAFAIAQNEGRDPLAIGFDLDGQGEVVLRQMPSMESLDLIKRGLDAELNTFRNKLTGKLDLEGEPEAKAINNLLQQFKTKIDDISPTYKAARAKYSAEIAPRTALQQGYDMLPKTNLPRRQFDEALAGMGERQIPEAQRGFATNMADEVAKRRLSGNPYDAVYGSPLQQGKVAALFPEGADDFARVYGLEKDMQKTATEILAGSQTQPRAMADAQFQGGMLGDVAEAAASTAVAGPGAGAASFGLNAVRRFGQKQIADRSRLGMFGAQKKAEALAPLLYDTNPGGILQMLDDLIRKNAEMEARKQAYGNAGSMLAFPAAGGAVLSAQ